MGKHQLRLLKFAIKHTGWHTYGKDRTTVNAVNNLVAKGLLKINDNRQFSLAS